MASSFSADEMEQLISDFDLETVQDSASGRWIARSFDGPPHYGDTREEACSEALRAAIAAEGDWQNHVDDETADYLELTDS